MNNKSLYNLKILLFLILGCICNKSLSQTNEIGFFLGGSMFQGDVGPQNAEKSILNTKPVWGLQFKRNLNYHFGVNLSITRGELYSSDDLSNDLFALQKNITFKSNITEFGLFLEFNFQPYLTRDPDYNNSTFIFSGITKFYFNPEGQYIDGNWYSLRPLSTEGQESDLYLARERYKLSGYSIPIGIGYKINAYEFLTISFNLGWRITFTDYIDDVSTTYVEESILTELGQVLADPSENNFNTGFQRGNPYTNDKYGFLGISILYSIKDRNKDCDNIVY